MSYFKVPPTQHRQQRRREINSHGREAMTCLREHRVMRPSHLSNIQPPNTPASLKGREESDLNLESLQYYNQRFICVPISNHYRWPSYFSNFTMRREKTFAIALSFLIAQIVHQSTLVRHAFSKRTFPPTTSLIHCILLFEELEG